MKKKTGGTNKPDGVEVLVCLRRTAITDDVRNTDKAQTLKRTRRVGGPAPSPEPASGPHTPLPSELDWELGGRCSGKRPSPSGDARAEAGEAFFTYLPGPDVSSI